MLHSIEVRTSNCQYNRYTRGITRISAMTHHSAHGFERTKSRYTRLPKFTLRTALIPSHRHGAAVATPTVASPFTAKCVGICCSYSARWQTRWQTSRVLSSSTSSKSINPTSISTHALHTQSATPLNKQIPPISKKYHPSHCDEKRPRTS